MSARRVMCRMSRSIVLMLLLAVAASGCGGIVVVDGRGASSDNASSTGAGGASAGTGSPFSGSAAGGTGGSSAPADCSAPTLTVLAENQMRPVDIAVDASNVYWVSYGGSDSLENAHVFALPKSGGTPVEIAVIEGEPTHLFVDDTHVYWDVGTKYPTFPEQAILYGMPKAGAPLTKIFAAPTPFYSLKMDEARFYWQSEGGDILSLPKAGGTPAVVVKGGNSVYAFEIAIDEDSLYWRTNGESLLMSTPKIGGASKLLSGQTGIGAFVPDATQMFVTPEELSHNGDIATLPKGGGTLVKIIHEESISYRLTSHGACLYWISSPILQTDHDEIHAAPKTGGEPIVIFHAASDEGDFQFTVDASGVYTADTYSGLIVKTAK